MTDYWGIALAGFATGVGVIAAQRFVSWLEKHPIILSIKRHADDITRYRHR